MLLLGHGGRADVGGGDGFGERDDGEAVVLVVVGDKGDGVCLRGRVRAQEGLVEGYHGLEPIRAEDYVDELGGREDGGAVSSCHCTV